MVLVQQWLAVPVAFFDFDSHSREHQYRIGLEDPGSGTTNDPRARIIPAGSQAGLVRLYRCGDLGVVLGLFPPLPVADELDDEEGGADEALAALEDNYGGCNVADDGGT